MAAPGFVSNPTIAIGPNLPIGGDLTIAFTSFQNVFGSDLFTNVGGKPSDGAAPFTISFFNGLTSVQSYSLMVPSTGSFFGLVGGSLFDRVTISETLGYATVDNVQFGTQAIVAGGRA